MSSHSSVGAGVFLLKAIQQASQIVLGQRILDNPNSLGDNLFRNARKNVYYEIRSTHKAMARPFVVGLVGYW